MIIQESSLEPCLLTDNLLDRITPCKRGVHDIVDHTDPRPQPEVVVQVAVVEVRGEPALAAPGRGHGRHQPDHQRVHVVRQRHGQELERRAQAAHRRGRLRVEELQLRDATEDVGAGQDHELRQLPPDAQVVAGLDAAQPPRLHQRGGRQGRDRQQPPHAHPLQQRQPHRVPRVPPGDRDHDAVLERHPDEHEDHLGGVHGGGGHGEGPDLSVHRVPLLNEGGSSLAHRSRVEDAGEPYWKHPDQNLHFLHLGYRT